MNNKYLVLLIFTIFSTTQVLGASVKPYSYTIDDEDGTFIGMSQTTTGTNSNSLVTEYDSSMSKVYLPVNTGGTQLDYSVLDFTDEMPPLTSDSYLQPTLLVTTTSSDIYYLNAAFADSSGQYFAIPLRKTQQLYDLAAGDSEYYSFDSSGTDVQVAPYLNLYAMCGGTDCELSGNKLSIKVFFFLSIDSPEVTGTTITPSEHSGGATIEFLLSDLVPNYTTELKELRKGDGRLIANISSANILDAYRTITFYKRDAEDREDNFSGLDTYVAAAAVYTKGKMYPFTHDGDVTFSDLDNGIPYSFAVALINKYQFGTKVSNRDFNTPESIKTFIQQQQCYLLSAGFQEEHYVIEYFKVIRDQYLLKSWPGTKLVQFYYWSAPHFTHYIYESSLLSSLFRAIGYSLYFIFHNITVVMMTIIGSVLLLFYRRNNMIKTVSN